MDVKIEKNLYAIDFRIGEVHQYWLCNQNGVRVGILDYGLTITDFILPDRNGDLVNIVLGFKDFASLRAQSAYVNAIIGRYANRIANSGFTVHGRKFTLGSNENNHHLHGGVTGFDKRKWSIEKLYNDNEKCFLFAHLTSADGEEGYPGALECSIVISLDDNNNLTFEIVAESSRLTHVNITSHLYFNLSGEEGDGIGDHVFTIPSKEVLDIDEFGIPSGGISSVNSGALDFSEPKCLRNALSCPDNEIKKRNGIDHCYVFKLHNEFSSMRMAKVECPSTGFQLFLDSTQPGLQFYTGQYLQDVVSRNGHLYVPFSGFCLEPQHFPDTPNQPAFPSTLLFPGEKYKQCFTYKVNVVGGV